MARSQTSFSASIASVWRALRDQSKTYPQTIAVYAGLACIIGVFQPPIWAAISLATIGFSLCSALLYRAADQHGRTTSFITDWRNVFVSHILVAVFFGTVLFIASLFLIILAGVLVAVSGHDPTTADPSDTAASLEALQQSGAIWILYTLLGVGAAGCIWLLARILIAGPATIGEGRVMVFRTWGMTKPLLIRILSIGAFSLLPVVIATGALSALASQIPSPEVGVILRVLAWMPAFLMLHAFAASFYSTRTGA